MQDPVKNATQHQKRNAFKIGAATLIGVAVVALLVFLYTRQGSDPPDAAGFKRTADDSSDSGPAANVPSEPGLTVTAADGSFQFAYPVAPPERSEFDGTKPMHVNDNMSMYYMKMDDGVAYTVMYQYARLTLSDDQVVADALLDIRRDMLMEMFGKELTHEKRYQRDGLQVMELSFSLDPAASKGEGTVDVRSYFQERRAWILAVKWPTGMQNRELATQFFDSFKLLSDSKTDSSTAAVRTDAEQGSSDGLDSLFVPEDLDEPPADDPPKEDLFVADDVDLQPSPEDQLPDDDDRIEIGVMLDEALPPEYTGSTPVEIAAIAAIERDGGAVTYRFHDKRDGAIAVAFDSAMDGDLLHLGQLHNVQRLNLAGCYKLTDAGMHLIGQLSQLRELHLNATDFADAGFGALEKLSQLEVLYLSSTLISTQGLSALQDLNNLQTLSLYDTQVSDQGLAYLAGLAQLNELNLARTKVTDNGLQHLKQMKQLVTLDLQDTRVIDAGLAHISKLTNLERLSLSDNQITDRGLQHLSGLSRLKSLNLSRSGISDEGLVHLAGLANLKFLSLMDTRVSSKGSESIKTKLPEAKIVTGQTDAFRNRQLVKAIGHHPDEQQTVERLEQLGAHVMIGRDRRVWWVEAMLPRFDDDDLALVKQLENLQRLELSSSRVTDKGLEHLLKLKRLRQVFIQETNVTPEGLEQIRARMPPSSSSIDDARTHAGIAFPDKTLVHFGLRR